MSVIQQIQEKYAKVMAVIIALALITFVVMLAFENGNTIFGGPSSVIGKVNGEKIDVNEFGEEFKKIEDRLQASQQTYGLTGPALTQRALQETWDREVNKILLNDEADNLVSVFRLPSLTTCCSVLTLLPTFVRWVPIRRQVNTMPKQFASVSTKSKEVKMYR